MMMTRGPRLHPSNSASALCSGQWKELETASEEDKLRGGEIITGSPDLQISFWLRALQLAFSSSFECTSSSVHPQRRKVRMIHRHRYPHLPNTRSSRLQTATFARASQTKSPLRCERKGLGSRDRKRIKTELSRGGRIGKKKCGKKKLGSWGKRTRAASWNAENRGEGEPRKPKSTPRCLKPSYLHSRSEKAVCLFSAQKRISDRSLVPWRYLYWSLQQHDVIEKKGLVSCSLVSVQM
jgi:hypothetical protein